MTCSRYLLFLIFLSNLETSNGQTIVYGGIFTGFTIPVTIDGGINRDPRYQAGYNLKWAPVGIIAGVDFKDFGIMISPSLFQTGQNYFIVNTVGGHIGQRDIDLTYLHIPVGAKVKIIDLEFFRVNAVSSLGIAFPVKGSETIRHSNGRLYFPIEVHDILSPDYTVSGNEVIVPPKNFKTMSQNDFKSLQVYASMGFRFDWDVTEKTRISIDLRGNYGFLEPRSDAYVDRVKNFQAIYEIYGRRHDVFIGFNAGVQRTLEIERKGSKTKKIKYVPDRRKRR